MLKDKEEQSKYNHDYYMKNRDAIRAKQKAVGNKHRETHRTISTLIEHSMFQAVKVAFYKYKMKHPFVKFGQYIILALKKGMEELS